jgi:hypothetical protein
MKESIPGVISRLYTYRCRSRVMYARLIYIQVICSRMMYMPGVISQVYVKGKGYVLCQVLYNQGKCIIQVKDDKMIR